MGEHVVDKKKAVYHLKMIQTTAKALAEGAIKADYAAERINEEVLEAHTTITGMTHKEEKSDNTANSKRDSTTGSSVSAVDEPSV